ncbi:unnamed protein product [Caenorhabditis sp. 36 PRJEB53466]|nr:unnamed protein product [Caenorhabditis sp. 36 PRJEB53466]
MERANNALMASFLRLENVVMSGNTEDINAVFNQDPVFKHPRIPEKYPITYFWLCYRLGENGRREYYWVFWTRGQIERNVTYGPILADNPIEMLEKRPDFHRNMVDSLWASDGDFPTYEREMIDDNSTNLTMEMFENDEYFKEFTNNMKQDNNLGNWRDRIFNMVLKKRIEYYQERYRLSRNDHYLKMAVFWKYLDWKVISDEHFSVMIMCFFKQIDLGFVDALFRAHYS